MSEAEMVAEILTDLCTELEGAFKNAKLRIGEIYLSKDSSSPPSTAPAQEEAWTWNPEKIPWVEKTGPKGQYDQSEDVNNPEFKALLKDLSAHEGKLTRDGCFYWVFQNGSTVGRKKRTYTVGTKSSCILAE
jgi:hypothetical protein